MPYFLANGPEANDSESESRELKERFFLVGEVY